MRPVLGYPLSGWALALAPLVPVVGGGVLLALRRRGWAAAIGWGMLAGWLVAVVLVTLTPGRLSYHPGVCAFAWSGSASDFGSTDAKILNVLMFVPLGLFAAMLVRRTVLPLLLSPLVSPAIEWVQREFPQLHRSCDLVDVIDNSTGLAIGAVGGLLVVW